MGLVPQACLDDLLNHSNLLRNMSASTWFNARRLHIQQSHILVVAVGIALNNLHRLQGLQTRLLCNLVYTFFGIAF